MHRCERVSIPSTPATPHVTEHCDQPEKSVQQGAFEQFCVSVNG
jgi:hypothetical protein